jgi:hypothetical protein
MDNLTQGGWRKTLAALLPLFGLVVALLGPLAPGARAQDTSLEEIEAEDPWTKGDPELLKKLGIERIGAMPWTQSHASDGVVKTLGGIPVIFIETEHFRLASTLESYRPTGDRPEKERLEAEFAALKKRCNKFSKLPPKLDPWLRAHLYAYRMEQVYDQFMAAFDLKDADFASPLRKSADGRSLGQGPYLGQKNKFTVLLTQSQSAMGRYLRANFNIEPEYSFRSSWPDGYLLAMNFEAFKSGGRDLDQAMHVAMAAALVQNLLDGYRASFQAPPNWLRYGLAHWIARRIDTRFNQWNAGGASSDPESDRSHLWEPRVLGLIKNEAATPLSKMMRWHKYEEIQPREHMLAWALVDWILTARKDTAHDLLFELAEPINDYGPTRGDKIVEQQERAFTKVWNMTPEQVDKAFQTWVEKNYKK